MTNDQWPIGNKTQEKLNEKSKEFIHHLLIIDHWSLNIDLFSFSLIIAN